MGCLNCNAELNHTPGKRKKQFCSPDCRVRYWQKNKPKKKGLDLPADYLKVKKVGILKADGTVAELDLKDVPEGAWKTAMMAMLDLSKYGSFLPANPPTFISTSQNKPLPRNPDLENANTHLITPKMAEEYGKETCKTVFKAISELAEQKSVKAPSKPEKGKEEAENGSEPTPPPPEGLTGIALMVWKNDQKLKTQPKAAPITQFGVTKKVKNQ
jgi:hypothetical protein